MTLYDIAEQFNEILENCEDMTDDELNQALFAVNSDFADKIQNCVYFIRNQESDCAVLDDEIKRLQARKASKLKKIDNLKKYMLGGMETMQRPKIEYANFSVWTQNNPPKVVVENEELIPDNFKVSKTVISIDKKAIKDAGGCVGAEIVQEKSVRIK